MNKMNLMKQRMIYLMFVLLTVSCSGQSDKQTESAGTSEVAQANEDSTQISEVDGMSGATNVSNPPSFNGVIMMPPQNHVTVTLGMGGSVRDIRVMLGEYVRKGQIILTLANPAFIELQQSYLDAAAQTEYLKKEYDRQQKLVSGESASLKRMQQSKADYLSMKSRMEAAAAQLALLGTDTATLNRESIRTYLDIRAPRNGYVTNMDINAGKYFAAGDPVCDVIDKSKPMLQLTAYEKDLDKLQPNTHFTFKVNGMPDTTFTAELVSVDQMVDNVNRSIKVYARILEAYSNYDKAAEMINDLRKRPDTVKEGFENDMLVNANDITIDFILDERARELAGEYVRWTDLKRTHKLVEYVTQYNEDGVSEAAMTGPDGKYKILRPIPQAAIDLNQATIEQNPGY